MFARRPLLTTLCALAFAAFAAPAAPAATTITLRSALTIRMTPVAPATMAGTTLSLPVARVRGAAVTHAGALQLTAGRHSVVVRAIRTTPSRLTGRIAGVRRTIASRRGARLTLTRTGARTLERPLGRALPRRLGTIRVDRTAPRPAPLAVSGGELAWGWSPGIAGAFADAFPPVLSGGATLSSDGRFHLPLTGGRYDAATRTGRLTATGGFRVGYQLRPADGSGAHGIWVSIWNAEIDLDGDRGALRAASESGYHGTPPVPAAVRTIATLDLRGILPLRSADGRTLTWPAIPASIAPGGQELVAAFADRPDRTPLGDTRALAPVTIVARVAG